MSMVLRRAPLLVALLFFTVVCLHSPAEIPLRDPGIPGGEFAVYRISSDAGTSVRRESVSVGEENGRTTYEIAVESETGRTSVRLFKDSMVPFHVHTTSVEKGYTSESSTFIRYEARVQSEHIILLGMEDLKYALRGFPFDSSETLQIRSLGESDGGESQFGMKVKVKKRETVDVGERRIDCYRLQLSVALSGAFSIINGLIPKSHFWYSAAPPHYLVAYEMSMGPPGSSKGRVEILEYSGWR